MNNSDKLAFNDHILDLFEIYLSTVDDIEVFVDHVKFLGFYLASSPCSRLYSTVIDDKIKRFQQKLPQIESFSEKKTLHIATQIYLTGGHTRVIENWINFSYPENHDLVLTEQYRHFEIRTPKKTNIIKIDDSYSAEQKISILNELYSKYEKVIFHIHQHDVIPLIAMGKHSREKFFFYNHADHTFNIGPSLVGEVYDMSEQGRIFSLNFRAAKSSKVIPFPLNITPPLASLKQDVKTKLNLPGEAKVVLTVGTNYKFIPNEKFNLFESFEKLALKRPDFHFVFIGPDLSFTKYLSRPMSNIHFLGLVDKATVLNYYQASDLYVDSLPVGGGLAMIEAVLSGLPIITFNNGFNAFDIAVKFQIEYENIDKKLEYYLDQEDERLELKKLCYGEAIKHTKQEWPNNFKQKSLSLSETDLLSSEILANYCRVFSSKYPQYNRPRTSYKLSNSILLKLKSVFPKMFWLSLILFQLLFPLIKPILRFLIDKKIKVSR